MENTHEVQTALIYFIQSKPEGNALRDIAIRTLKDLNWKEEQIYYGTDELKTERLTKVEREAKKPIQFEIINRREINVHARKNLIKLRGQAKMSQDHFAKVINIERGTYKHYERGKTVVPIDIAVNVCSAFNIPLEKFLTQSI
jgi:DNA-binding XRE family transcriptional regulator